MASDPGRNWPMQQPVNPNPPRQSDQRFRSFCERYLVTRSEFFRKDPDGLAEDTWTCILDAKRAYALIRRVGLSDHEDMSF